MNSPVVYNRLQNIEEVIDKIIEDTKEGEIGWKRCENNPDYSLVSKEPIEGRKIFLKNNDQMLVSEKEGCIPFIYTGKGVRKLYRTASFDVMPEGIEEWVRMIIDSN